MVLTDKQKILIDDYNDMAFVYSILCLRTSNYFGRLKYITDLPIIISSATISIINSNLQENVEGLKIANISFNILTAVLISINNFSKISEKRQIFKLLSDKFSKLSHKIEEKKIMNKIDMDFISNVINQYETAVESIDFDFPESIKKAVRDEYKTQRTLPPVINNCKKLMEFRDIELTGMKSENTTGNNSPNKENKQPMRSSIQYHNDDTSNIIIGDNQKNVSFESFFIDNGEKTVLKLPKVIPVKIHNENVLC